VAIELGAIEAGLEEQLNERPYMTLAAVAGIGWILGRTRPWGALLALAGVGVRTVLASALENALSENLGARPARTRRKRTQRTRADA
jgi:hypothetical protein